jgi:hypothetical protein
MRHPLRFLASLILACFGAAAAMQAGSATDVTGLYYTGHNSSGGLAAGGARDANWDVTYARVNGTEYTAATSTYTGDAYVLSSSYIDGAYVANTPNAQWITAPGASTAGSGGTLNVGGDFLPGNGTSGTNSAYYVYRLAFTISGTGSGNVTNNIQISMTIAADDAYTVYVNPASSPTVNNSGTISTGGTAASASGTSAWNNTTSITLGNGTSGGGTNNSTFKIGTNYIYVVVANTNSQTGTTSANALNPSGLLVYQVGSGVTIDGKPVPEVGTILPVIGALGLFGFRWLRRRQIGIAS